MGIERVSDQRLLLFHCAFTCLYFVVILTFLKVNERLYDIGTFKFMPILVLLTFAEVIKLLYSLRLSRHSTLGKLDGGQSSRNRKSWSRGLKESTRLLIIVLVLFVIYYTIIVLFGAPFLSSHEETSTLALTLVALTFVPARLHLGNDAALRVLTTSRPNGVGLLGEAIRLNIKTTLLGAWAGAMVIPLDWNRPWQVWPIPCVLGALLGYTLGHALALVKVSLALGRNKKTRG